MKKIRFCVEETEFCTSVWKELGSVPKCGGDWVLYQCVEGIRFCTSV